MLLTPCFAPNGKGVTLSEGYLAKITPLFTLVSNQQAGISFKNTPNIHACYNGHGAGHKLPVCGSLTW